MAQESSLNDRLMRLFTSIESNEKIADDVAYNILWEQIKITDFSDLERSGCVTIRNYPSNTKIPLIIFLPKLGLNSYVSYGNSNQDSIILQRILLYFIKCVHDVIFTGKYVLIYGHTPLSILSQQPLIYKYYKLLPRPYKKNLQNLVILHPQFGIKMLFEFSKVFVSQKFYRKLILVNSICELQTMISLHDLVLPYKFIKQEDDDFEYKYVSGNIPSLIECYVPVLGTTKLLCDCINYLREHGAFQHVGIFRIPGDENILNLAKFRMQRMASTCISGIPVFHDKIIIGYDSISDSDSDDEDNKDHDAFVQDSDAKSTSDISNNQATTNKEGKKRKDSKRKIFFKPSSKTFVQGFSGLLGTFSRSPVSSQVVDPYDVLPAAPSSSVLSPTNGDPPSPPLASPLHAATSNSQANVPPNASPQVNKIATVVFTDIDTIAQILKFSLRELPEPLITYDAFDSLIQITRKWKSNSHGYDQDQWEIDTIKIINSMPSEHKATLDHLLYFLAEVASHSNENNMDMSNLSTVFSPTIMHSKESRDDPTKFLSEIGFSTTVLLHLIKKSSEKLESTRRRAVSDAPLSIKSSSPYSDPHLSARVDSSKIEEQLAQANYRLRNAKVLRSPKRVVSIDLSKNSYQEDVSISGMHAFPDHDIPKSTDPIKIDNSSSSIDQSPLSTSPLSSLSLNDDLLNLHPHKNRRSINLKKYPHDMKDNLSEISDRSRSNTEGFVSARESLMETPRTSDTSRISNYSKGLDELRPEELNTALGQIESGLSAGMLDRMNRGGRGRGVKHDEAKE